MYSPDSGAACPVTQPRELVLVIISVVITSKGSARPVPVSEVRRSVVVSMHIICAGRWQQVHPSENGKTTGVCQSEGEVEGVIQPLTSHICCRTSWSLHQVVRSDPMADNCRLKGYFVLRYAQQGLNTVEEALAPSASPL